MRDAFEYNLHKGEVLQKKTMGPQDEVTTLTNMGLTSIQATVYLTLVQLGDSTVKTISKKTNVARPDIYRVMDQLEKISLVERIISAPVKFRATSIEDTLSSLIKRRAEETWALNTMA